MMEENKFKNASPETMINAFEKVTKTDLDSLFESWINGKVKIIAIS